MKQIAILNRSQKHPSKNAWDDRSQASLSLSPLISYLRVIDSAVNWAPYGGAFEDDFISVCRRPFGMLHIRTSVIRAHDASPFHVAAVPLAGNCRGDRSSLCIGDRATL